MDCWRIYGNNVSIAISIFAPASPFAFRIGQKLTPDEDLQVITYFSVFGLPNFKESKPTSDSKNDWLGNYTFALNSSIENNQTDSLIGTHYSHNYLFHTYKCLSRLCRENYSAFTIEFHTGKAGSNLCIYSFEILTPI